MSSDKHLVNGILSSVNSILCTH